MVDAKNLSKNCALIADNEFKYKNIPEEKITEIKKQVKNFQEL
jgi:hypothetical protein